MVSHPLALLTPSGLLGVILPPGHSPSFLFLTQQFIFCWGLCWVLSAFLAQQFHFCWGIPLRWIATNTSLSSLFFTQLLIVC